MYVVHCTVYTLQIVRIYVVKFLALNIFTLLEKEAQLLKEEEERKRKEEELEKENEDENKDDNKEKEEEGRRINFIIAILSLISNHNHIRGGVTRTIRRTETPNHDLPRLPVLL